MMKKTVILVSLLMAGCVGPKAQDPTALVDPSAITRVVVGEAIVPEVDPFAADQPKQSGKPKFKVYFTIDDQPTVHELIRLVSAMEKRVDFSVPAIGILSEQQFLNQDGDIILKTHIVNWKCCVVLTDGPGTGPDYRTEGFSKEFCEIIFRQMRERSPEIIKSQQESYQELGLTLEGLLFRGDATRKAQPPAGGDGKPAPQP
jgi:hypothetical protein